MLTYNAQRATKAVQFLVDSSYFSHHVTKLRSTVKKPRAMPFKGEAEVLNELLVIGRQNLHAMENLIAVAKGKRTPRGEYQAQYMAQKRLRDRKVVQLESILAGRKLNLDERVQVIQKQYDVWNRELERILAEQNTGWKDRNEVRRLFWTKKEEELDALIVEAQAQAERTVQRKRQVVIEKKDPKTLLGQRLQEAMTGKKLTLRKK
jgi:hypothetical protein